MLSAQTEMSLTNAWGCWWSHSANVGGLEVTSKQMDQRERTHIGCKWLVHSVGCT